MERERERVKELEMTLQDKEEMVRIVEKKSNGLVRIMFDGVCDMNRFVFVLACIHSSQLDTCTCTISPTHSLSVLFSLSHSLTHCLVLSPTHSLTVLFSLSLTHSLSCSFSPTHSLTVLFSLSLTHSLSCSLSHSLTHCLVLSLSLTHSLTLSAYSIRMLDTCTCTISHSLTVLFSLSHTHTHTHTHTHYLSL